jgi:DNA (cytosine-5)-methyltransferase 1
VLNGLDLFSGIGGISLALHGFVRTVAYCEIDRYAQAVLLSRMEAGELERAPIWDDVKTLTSKELPSIDIISGGFPCQDVSVAGLGKGLDGERTGLFREAIRLIRECKPQFVFFENVPGIRRYVPSVRGELEALGYDCRDGFLSAAEVGANHNRNRWWLLAYSNSERGRAKQISELGQRNSAKFGNDGEKKSLANSKRYSQGSNEGQREGEKAPVSSSGFCGEWSIEPDVGRVANGIPFRVDRIKGLGNAIVPAQGREAFKILMGIKE